MMGTIATVLKHGEDLPYRAVTGYVRSDPLGLSVCLPAYNEESNIAAMVRDVVDTMSSRFSTIEVVVVNDGSTDRTADVLRELEDQYPCLRTLHHRRNLGYGAAVHAALSAATQDLLLSTDSDRQFALSEIDRFAPLMGGHDMVIGYRARRGDPTARVVLGAAWTTLGNRLFGYLARDVNCAFKLVWRDVFRDVGPAIRSRGATFAAEWLTRTRRAGFRIAEVPVTHYPRPAGSQTGANPLVVARAVIELLKLRWEL